MKKYTISYEGRFTRLANGDFGNEHKVVFIYANNDFEAGCELGNYMDFEGGATIEKVEELKGEYPNVTFTVPPMFACTDNATMIAVAGTIAYEHGRRADASLTADANWEIQ